MEPTENPTESGAPAVLKTRGAGPLARLRPWAPELAAVLLLLALPIAVLAPQALGGRSVVPHDALVSDPVFRGPLQDAGVEQPQNGLVADLIYQNWVWKELLLRRLSDGEAPLWNPYLFGGMPFLAGGQHGLFTPQTALFMWLDPDRAFVWGAVLLLWWAGLGGYVLGRAAGLTRGASTVGAVAWSLSTLFVSHVVFPMFQGAMGWTPWLLAGMTRLTKPPPSGSHPPPWLPRDRVAAWWLLSASATALVALAGHAEMLMYAAIVAAAYGLWRLEGLRRATGWRAVAPVAGWLSLAALTGALVAATQWAPMLELAGTNHRAGTSYAEAVGYAFGIRQLITFLVPDFYGNPAHHVVPLLEGWRRVGLEDHAMWGTAWGAQNYVEAAAYVGLLPWLLAPVALADRRRRRLALFFAGLGVVSLLLAFGSPLYRLVYLLPGIDQLRSPFRWIFPLVLAQSVLAAMGADALLRSKASEGRATRRVGRFVGSAAIGAGIWLGLSLALGWVFPRRWVRVVEAVLRRLPDAPEAMAGTFPDVETFAAYQFWNLLHLAVFLVLSAVALLAMARAARRGAEAGERRRAAGIALAVLVSDLTLIGMGFNPAVEPDLGRVEPEALAFLAEASEIEWGRVIGFGEEKVLWPNSAMRAGVADLRGYDSIIPWWTAETLDAIESQSGWLRFNRIGNPKEEASLAHPALAALGGRYVVTREPIDAPGLELIYDGDVRIYDNTAAMPRAWVVNEVRVVEDRLALLGDLASFDPRREVLLEEAPDTAFWETLPRGRQVFNATITVQRESGNALELDVFAGAPGMLVLSEAYFPGWRAWVTPATAGAEEIEVPIYRADGAIRALPVPAGRMRVRLQYFPMSIKLGLYGSFLGLILLFLMSVYALWTRFVRIDQEDTVQRVALNSAGPIGAALVGKILLFVFAMLYLRVLGPELAGRYYLAVTVYTLADIITNFGLNLLVAREVAKRPEEAPELLASSATLRMIFVLLTLPALAGYVWLQGSLGRPLAEDTQVAITLLALALVPANLNTALSSVFQGLERMVLPAAVSILSALLTVSLGALALLAGWGFVGLAGMAIVTNWLTFCVLVALARKEGIRPWGRVSSKRMRWMAGTSLPLMLNHLLAVVFFKIDVLLLEPMKGSLVVGWYQSAYKWVEALLIIPAYLTMALFPLMSRRAQDDREGLAFAYTHTVRWLLALALPIAVATTFLAEPLIRLLGGEDYLPQGAMTLQIMIWFLPFSYVNGVTQYVLIALDRQRWITLSFAVAATFNIVANLLVIPEYGHLGAATVTIISEIVLMAPFFWGLRDLGAPPLLVLSWRPLLGASLMALLLSGAAGAGMPWIPAAMLGGAGYLLALRLMGWLTEADREVLARLMPGGSAAGRIDGATETGAAD